MTMHELFGFIDKEIPVIVLISDPALFNTGSIPISEFLDRWHDVDEGEIRTYQVGVAVYGKKPFFSHKQMERFR
jgi:hypothetical protein